VFDADGDAGGGMDQVVEDRDRLDDETHHQGHAVDRNAVEEAHGGCSAADNGGEDAVAGSGA